MSFECCCENNELSGDGYKLTCQTCFKSWNKMEYRVRELLNRNRELKKEIIDYRTALSYYANRMDSGGTAREALRKYGLSNTATPFQASTVISS